MGSRIAHLVAREEGEDVWMAGGEGGAVTLHVVSGRPVSLVAHSVREIPGRPRVGTCRRLEGMPCWSLTGLTDEPLKEALAQIRMCADELWAILDDCYRLYLEGR